MDGVADVQLSVRTAEAVAVRQDLIGQHQRVEERLQELAAAAGEEVRMLARMWQLQNKMGAVGEPATYRSDALTPGGRGTED